MLLTDVWELFGYWKDYPPAHVILAARYMPRDSRSEEPTAAEMWMLNSLPRNGPSESYATLPPSVKAAIDQMRTANA